MCRDRLVKVFGADTDMADITPADADRFLVFLRERYADGTSGPSIKQAKQFFRAAVRGKLIAENPFADIKAPSQVNDERLEFISLETAYKVLEACPDAEWRLIFALARFGGLRCPSEHMALAWADVDWERNRFRVDAPKTGVRWVPIFAELKPYLEEAFESAAEGEVHVITRYRDTNMNLRTQLQRIIKRAGVEPWGKLFQNLRSTRETELAASHPIHVVCEWIGNSIDVAAKHYLQVTDADFERASNSAPNSALSTKTARQTAQHGERTENAPSEKDRGIMLDSAKPPAFSEEKGYARRGSNPQPMVSKTIALSS
jgi:integrase